MIDDDHRVVLKSISEGVDCEHDYINATYIDVRLNIAIEIHTTLQNVKSKCLISEK